MAKENSFCSYLDGIVWPLTGSSQEETAFSGKADAYIKPFVQTKNFSGTVLVAKNGKVIYLKAFGWPANRWRWPTNRIQNTTSLLYPKVSRRLQFYYLKSEVVCISVTLCPLSSPTTPMAIRSLFIICLLILPAYPILIICPNMLTCLFYRKRLLLLLMLSK